MLECLHGVIGDVVMAKKTISVNLNEKTIDEIDKLAEKMGVSRSMFCEMTLSTAVGGQTLHDFTRWLFARSDEEKEDEKSDFVTA